MAQTQTSVASRLPACMTCDEHLKLSFIHPSDDSEAKASSQEGQAVSAPTLSPSTLDIGLSNSTHRGLMLSLRSPQQIAHASDNPPVEARVQDHWGQSALSNNMGFHPDAYGCPTAKRRFSDAGQDRSQTGVHPDWNLSLKQPVGQQSSWASRRQSQNGVMIQGGSTATKAEPNDKRVSSSVRTNGVEHHLTNFEVCEAVPTEPISNPTPGPASSLSIQILGFDKKAYGDPTRRVSGQTASASRGCRPELRLSPRTKPESADWSETEADPHTASVKLEPDPQGLQTAKPLLTPYLTSFHTPSNKPQTNLQAGHNTVDVEMHKYQQPRKVASPSQMSSAKKSGSPPHPETFQTLRQGSETPEQLIARLQETQCREAFRRIRQKEYADESVTTGLAMLHLLREPLPPDPDELHSGMGNIRTGASPDLELHLLQDQSSRARDGSADSSPSASKQKRTAESWSDVNELEPPQCNSAEDSEEPESDNDSTRPMAVGFGRLIRSHEPPVPEEELAGWDGKFLPPPLDWERRGRFYNNTLEYISGFESWLGAATMRTMSRGPEVDFLALPLEEVQNIDNHADGIGFVPKQTMVNESNAGRYGFNSDSFKSGEVMKPESWSPPDFNGNPKLDLSDTENVRLKDETAQKLIDNRIERLRRAERQVQENVMLRVQVEHENSAVAEEVNPKEQPPPLITTKNIYLRPAVSADVPGMRAILNWHIAQGTRPSELTEISEENMNQRLEDSTSNRLPVIVAVERNRKTSRPKSRRASRVNSNHPIQNTDPEYIGVVKDEPVVGWASATDWSASDYIEAITAELEVYVAPSHRKSGVGRCLLDALLDATDRGYLKKGGYEFRVAPELRHMYSAGGGRNLHKLMVQVRSFNNPMPPELLDRLREAAIQGQPDPPASRNGWGRRNGEDSRNRKNRIPENLSSENARKKRKDYSKAARLDDREDDYEIWLKEWLESQGFEEEAHLKKIGTKKGRFVDVRYLSRETCWQPVDHRIPDFSHGI
ncbi:uncharacterized protein Z519_01541 [Cladophialophora bantiana CBS 173.52]|uniref:N-acetyltransferase domain-containing protein n=1 Tax=Cladophialophora bantiana (strain ATCC 10958 / CBS 173.52 / CDC B-1940 / NIH 8579) TaxID=1442370 RepID=A0A0D2GHY7_CLAB1|nr:uncharacterized protein Z519_01541 [Cladophialophora bantiana CBS 173.52]KIW97957.1 hypothetical protein Z519_01541 [Cladophialophora bantiana CBS 173.52]